MKKKVQLAFVLSMLALLLASCSTRAYYDQAKGQGGQQSIFANGQTWTTDNVPTVIETTPSPVNDAAVSDGGVVILDATQMADDVLTAPPADPAATENPVSVDTPTEVEPPVVTPQLVDTAIPVDLIEPSWFDDALFISHVFFVEIKGEDVSSASIENIKINYSFCDIYKIPNIIATNLPLPSYKQSEVFFVPHLRHYLLARTFYKFCVIVNVLIIERPICNAIDARIRYFYVIMVSNISIKSIPFLTNKHFIIRRNHSYVCQ